MKTSILIGLSAVLFSGCAFFPRSAYDSVAADDIRELARRTNEVVADGNAHRLSATDSRQFLQQSKAQVQVLRLHAPHGGMNKAALANLDSLDKEYDALLSRKSPLRSPAAAELQGTLFALQSLTPYRPYWMRAAGPSTIDDSTVDTSSTDSSATNAKDCGKGGDHGGHDHGGRDCGCDHGHR